MQSPETWETNIEKKFQGQTNANFSDLETKLSETVPQMVSHDSERAIVLFKHVH